MAKYRIYYNFDGAGQVDIEAKSKAEANELFFQGEWELDTEKETGSDYEVTQIQKIKKIKKNEKNRRAFK